MTAPQTSVSLDFPVGIAGQDATLESARNARKNFALQAESSANIPIGRFVQRGSTDKTAKLLTGATNVLAGMVCFSQNYGRGTDLTESPAAGSSAGELTPGASLAVAESGEFYVELASDVTPADDVHLFHTVGTGEQLVGRCGSAASAAKTLDISAFARWKRTGVSGGIGVLEFDLKMAALATADT